MRILATENCSQIRGSHGSAALGRIGISVFAVNLVKKGVTGHNIRPRRYQVRLADSAPKLSSAGVSLTNIDMPCLIVYNNTRRAANLQRAGMPTGVCPEQWILEHQEVIEELQKASKRSTPASIKYPICSL